MWSLDTLIRYPLLSQISADHIVFWEHSILVGLFLPFLLYQNSFKSLWHKKNILPFLVIGVMGSALSTVAFTKAFTLINPSLVILLQKLQPFVAIFLSRFLLKEKFEKHYFFYMGLSLVGAFCLSWPDMAGYFVADSAASVSSGADSSATAGVVSKTSSNMAGYLLTLVAVLGWGASTVFGKQLSNAHLKESTIMGGRFLYGFFGLVVYLIFSVQNPMQSLVLANGAQAASNLNAASSMQAGSSILFFGLSSSSIEILMKIFAMVLISGLAGMWFYYRGIKKVSAHVGALAELFFPFCAVTLNWIFLGHTLQPVQIVGALILIASVILLNRERVSRRD